MNIAANSLIGAFQFVGMFARGEISTEAFVRDLLSRSTQQANLNTFTWVNSDGALKAARAADRKRATGTPIGLLEGLPLVVKDNINTLGFPTSAGTRALKASMWRPGENAPEPKSDPPSSLSQQPPTPGSGMSSMENAEHTLRALAQVYFDAAYDMDAEQFQTIFHPLSAVTRIGDDGEVSVMPIETWLAGVRNATAPRKLQLERKDEVLAIDVSDNLALVKLRLQMPPRYLTDLLSCLKVQGTWKIVQKVMSVDVRQ